MTTAYFAPPGERTCLHWDGVTSTYCHGTEDVRPFLQGDRDRPHYPSTLVACPFCGDPVPGLLAGCDKPDCRRLELDEDVRLTRLEDQ